MTYREAVARLLALRGGEMAGMRPGLETIQGLLDAVGNPESRMRLVQIGGTNGKGSASAMVAAMLQADGIRTLVQYSSRAFMVSTKAENVRGWMM